MTENTLTPLFLSEAFHQSFLFSQITVSQVIAEITCRQGTFIANDFDTSINKLVKDICHMVTKKKQQQQEQQQLIPPTPTPQLQQIYSQSLYNIQSHSYSLYNIHLLKKRKNCIQEETVIRTYYFYKRRFYNGFAISFSFLKQFSFIHFNFFSQI